VTSRDGIGSPRKREVVERDRMVLGMIKDRHEAGLCTRLSDVRKVLPADLSRSQSFYVLKRLQTAGLIERRAGYLWCIPEAVAAIGLASIDVPDDARETT
jgi:hypothetical protein